MGAGGSKDKTKVIKTEPMDTSDQVQQLPRAPSNVPNLPTPSPAKNQSAKHQNLQRVESGEINDQRTPSQQAKQQKLQIAGMPGMVESSLESQQLPQPAAPPVVVKAEPTREEQMRKQKKQMEAKRQRQMEAERQMKIKAQKEQEKAQRAAKEASKAAELAKQKQFRQPNDTQGSEQILAQHTSHTNLPMEVQSIHQQPNRNMGKANNDLSINGAGFNGGDISSKASNRATAPIAATTIKVVQYQGQAFQNQNVGGLNSNVQIKNNNQARMNFGMYADDTEKDNEADRQINMNELNELLGI